MVAAAVAVGDRSLPPPPPWAGMSQTRHTIYTEATRDDVRGLSSLGDGCRLLDMHCWHVKQGAPPPYIAYYAVMALSGGDINFREESYWATKKKILGIWTRFFAGM